MNINDKNALGLKTAVISSLCNVLAAISKILFGILGNSYALIADGIESTLDIISSIIVWGGLKIASEPADHNHPYGHGKAESLAGVIVATILIAVGLGIGYNGILRVFQTDIVTPQQFTLYIFIVVIIGKEMLYHYVMRVAKKINSSSMEAEAWHHRSDAITTVMALLGVFIAIYWNYPQADGFAGILCGAIIIVNGSKILWNSANEVMDTVVSEEIYKTIETIALLHNEIKTVSNCRIRKSGLQYLLDIRIQVNPNITVAAGHAIANELEKSLLKNETFTIIDVVVHVEPYQ